MDCYQIDASRPRTNKTDDLFECHGPPEHHHRSPSPSVPTQEDPASGASSKSPPSTPPPKPRDADDLGAAAAQQSTPRRVAGSPRTPRADNLDIPICIDAKWYGSVGRYFNHSCEPNMAKQMVFVDSQDVRVPTIAFFALWDIPPKTELTYDYGYEINQVDGRTLTCHCGAETCRGRLY